MRLSFYSKRDSVVKCLSNADVLSSTKRCAFLRNKIRGEFGRRQMRRTDEDSVGQPQGVYQMDRFETLRKTRDGEGDRAEEEPALLVVVLDTNPAAWSTVGGDLTFDQAVATLLVFLNAHLALNAANAAAVVASHVDSARWLYPRRAAAAAKRRPMKRRDDDADRLANGYRPFMTMQDEVTSSLKRLLEGTAEDAVTSVDGSMMSGAMAMSLAYINRMEADLGDQVTLKSRIVVLSASGDLAVQYIPMMNCIFAAQKKRVAVDVCKVGADAAFLQQASDATKGIYHHLSDPSQAALLQHLLMLYLPDQSVRRWMCLPSRADVDFRAACFCHKDVLDVGYVCSVCLSSMFFPLMFEMHTDKHSLLPAVPEVSDVRRRV